MGKVPKRKKQTKSKEQEMMIVKSLCSECDHDIRFEDKTYGLLVAECKLDCDEYDPHTPVECINWRGKCQG